MPRVRPDAMGEGGSPSPRPSRSDLEALHTRMLARDPVAPAELAESVLERLTAALARRAGSLLHSRGATVRQDMLHDAATSAFMSYVKRPEQFKPGKSSLFTYLVMSAHGDLLNANETLQKRPTVIPLSLVDIGNAERNKTMTPVTGPSAHGVQAGAANSQGPDSAELEAKLNLMDNDQERAVLQQMENGERSSIVYADLLGIAHLPELEQRRRVKQVKDRIKKRVKRAGLTLYEGRDGQ